MSVANWPCEFKRRACRNPHGCHCAEIDALTAAKGKAHSRGVNAGMIVAAAICVKAHGEDVVAEEILNCAGLDSRRKAKAAGGDDYDLNILRRVFAQMKH